MIVHVRIPRPRREAIGAALERTIPLPRGDDEERREQALLEKLDERK